jgi:hypothetical protein
MKPSTSPMICGLALAAMSAAGFSHWWSVRSFASAVEKGMVLAPPVTPAVAQPQKQAPALPPAAPVLVAEAPKSTPPLLASEEAQRVLIETLTNINKRFEALQNQNRDLRDQVAETNRDVMNLGFRVDTHSESFRPMPLTEEQATSFDDGPGVLPPRAEPVSLPSNP